MLAGVKQTPGTTPFAFCHTIWLSLPCDSELMLLGFGRGSLKSFLIYWRQQVNRTRNWEFFRVVNFMAHREPFFNEANSTWNCFLGHFRGKLIASNLLLCSKPFKRSQPYGKKFYLPGHEWFIKQIQVPGLSIFFIFYSFLVLTAHSASAHYRYHCFSHSFLWSFCLYKVFPRAHTKAPK